MRAGMAAIAAALTAIAVAACGSDDPPSPSPPVAPPSSASPSADADTQARFCTDLNAFAAAAGPTFDIGAIALIDGESANERATVSQLVDSILSLGAILKPDLPAEVADDMLVVVGAASQAKTTLADGKPAQEAVDLLTAKEAKAAREAVVAYRGSC